MNNELTKKAALILRLNSLRTDNNLPPYDPKKLKMATEEIEGLIYHLETPSHDIRVKPKEDDVASLLARLNTLRLRQHMQPLKMAKSRSDTLRAIATAERELAARALSIRKAGPTTILEGSGLLRHKTSLHRNHVAEAMPRMRKQERQHKLRLQKETAKRVALWAGYAATNVLAYLQVKDIVNPALSGEELKADIKLFLANKLGARPQKRGKPKGEKRQWIEAEAKRLKLSDTQLLWWVNNDNVKSFDKPLTKKEEQALRKQLKSRPPPAKSPRKKADSNSLTPQDIADELKVDAKQIRVKLRKLEAKIPKQWRVAEERWGFKPEHKTDILKLLGGK